MGIIIDRLMHIYNKGQHDEFKALNEISMEIDSASIVGIIGHTGSGKSTLIQHLNGLLRPDSGNIYIDGENIFASSNLLQLRRKVGLVFQYPEHQLFEENVEKDIAFGPSNLGLSEEEISERVSFAAEMTGLNLEMIGKRSPFELSGGQKRKAAIAGVIAMKPEILVMDEPAAGLDPQAHRDMTNMIKRINKEMGCTVILVSHDMDDIADLCNKVFVMKKGSIVISGTPSEVFSQAERLQEMGLGMPASAELVWRLKKLSVDCRADILNEESVADSIAEILKI